MLKDKSLTDLRSIAQVHGVKDFLALTKPELTQAIEIKIGSLKPEPIIEIAKPEYDARLMTKTPARKSDREMIEDLLAPYVARGLRLTFPEPENWAMSFDKRNDTGTMRMPPRILLKCAERVLNG